MAAIAGERISPLYGLAVMAGYVRAGTSAPHAVCVEGFLSGIVWCGTSLVRVGIPLPDTRVAVKAALSDLRPGDHRDGSEAEVNLAVYMIAEISDGCLVGFSSMATYAGQVLIVAGRRDGQAMTGIAVYGGGLGSVAMA